jgi:hypothetical protein
MPFVLSRILSFGAPRNKNKSLEHYYKKIGAKGDLFD